MLQCRNVEGFLFLFMRGSEEDLKRIGIRFSDLIQPLATQGQGLRMDELK